jgi:hypothetical protein
MLSARHILRQLASSEAAGGTSEAVSDRWRVERFRQPPVERRRFLLLPCVGVTLIIMRRALALRARAVELLLEPLRGVINTELRKLPRLPVPLNAPRALLVPARYGLRHGCSCLPSLAHKGGLLAAVTSMRAEGANGAELFRGDRICQCRRKRRCCEGHAPMSPSNEHAARTLHGRCVHVAPTQRGRNVHATRALHAGYARVACTQATTLRFSQC